jgi:hypothetical protein
VPGLPFIPPVPKTKGPEASRRVAEANVNRDSAQERPGCGIEGVDLALNKTEIPHQQIARELTKTVRRDCDTPGRGKRTTNYRLL